MSSAEHKGGATSLAEQEGGAMAARAGWHSDIQGGAGRWSDDHVEARISNGNFCIEGERPQWTSEAE